MFDARVNNHGNVNKQTKGTVNKLTKFSKQCKSHLFHFIIVNETKTEFKHQMLARKLKRKQFSC